MVAHWLLGWLYRIEIERVIEGSDSGRAILSFDRWLRENNIRLGQDAPSA
jgi:hypothetical protein